MLRLIRNEQGFSQFRLLMLVLSIAIIICLGIPKAIGWWSIIVLILLIFIFAPWAMNKKRERRISAG